MDFSDFMDFYGCPAIVLEQRALTYWWGMFVQSTEKKKFHDFTNGDGENFTIDDTLDFNNPRTDYDRACCPIFNDHSHHLIKMRDEQREVLILQIAKGSVSWVNFLQAFVCIETVEDITKIPKDLPTLVNIPLDWVNPALWLVDDDQLVLFNSSMHGEDVGIDHQIIPVQKGMYQLRYASCNTAVAGYHLVQMIKTN